MGNGFPDGKAALITGAGRGVGRDITVMMARQGATVVVNDLGTEGDRTGQDGTPAESVKREITGAGGDAVADFDKAGAIPAKRPGFFALDRIADVFSWNPV